MKEAPEIVFTVTNDLTYDQRMQRICGTLAEAGYRVTLVGRLAPSSAEPDNRNYEQVRLPCRFQKGKLFYIEYNWRLYRYLVKRIRQCGLNSPPALCAIDLDTILPVLQASKKYKTLRVYDAHELFTELTEIKRRPYIAAIWNYIERKTVPHFTCGYTVNDFIAGEFRRRYNNDYKVIRNLPISGRPGADETVSLPALPQEPFFLYQGAVNEGRCFETLIPAMKLVNAPLVIAGEGNFFEQAKELSRKHGVTHKVFFLGYVKPAVLGMLTPKAFAGITLFENNGLNQYYSLANRFFDYIHAGIPQLCADFPEYKKINDAFEVAVLIKNLSFESIAASLNKLLVTTVFYNELQQNCHVAAKVLSWEKEAEKLIAYWQTISPLN